MRVFSFLLWTFYALSTSIVAANLSVDSSPTYVAISDIFATTFLVQNPSTELAITVNLVSGQPDAIVFCSGFSAASKTFNKPLVLADIYKPSFYTYSSNSVASVLVSGLIPATAYNIYCMTALETDYDVMMPLSVALTTSSMALTSCCKTATFTSTISNVYVGTSTVENNQALYLTLDYAPSINVTFSLSLASATSESTDPSSVGTLSTYSIVVPSTYIARTPIPVVLVAGLVDTYTITFEATGDSANEYILYGSTTTFSVVNLDFEPSAPVLSSAVFSSDGTYVIISFDSPTDQGGYLNTFPCNDLLYFDGQSSAICLWKDNSHILIYPHYDSPDTAVLTVDSSISLYSDAILPFCSDDVTDCASWSHYSASDTVHVLSPTGTADLPAVMVSGPSTVGPCSSLLLDWTSSVGSAGRPWTSTSITVSDSIEDGTVTPLQDFLASDSYTISPPVAILQSYLIVGHTYNFTGVFCNFLGYCGTASKVVTISSADDTPVVSINGMTSRTVTAWSTFMLTASAYTESCDGTKSVSGLQYTWTAVKDILETPTVTSISQNPAVLKLSPYSLSVGSTYQFQVSVKAGQSSSVSSASVSVTVVQSDLVAVLNKGPSFSLQVGLDEYRIYASDSYDQDIPSDQTSGSELSFVWSCYQIFPSFSTLCPVLLSTVSSASITLNSVGAEVGSVARVSVTVYDTTRSATSHVDITLTTSSTARIGLASSITAPTLNTNQQLILTGFLLVPSACVATWSVDDDSVSLESAALTPLQTSWSNDSNIGDSQVQLLLPAGSLPQRATLVFSLTCGSVSNSLTILTNGSPLPGLFTLIPTSGEELTTPYLFSAYQWVDPDLPLSYQFGFISANTGAAVTIQSKSEKTYVTTKMAAGSSTNDYIVSLELLVYDALGASDLAVGSVTVSPFSNVTSQAAAISALIAASSGSVDDTTSLIATLGEVLSAVDCSAATDCAALNREECSLVSNTCSVCLSGYLGPSGPDNSACVSLAEYLNLRRLTVGSHCSTNAGCNTGNWEVCSSHVCTQQSKSCPNDCSGVGVCLYFDVSTGESVESCGISDTSCKSQCQCTSGSGGVDCGLSSSKLAVRLSVRDQLTEALHNVSMIDDVNEYSIQNWATWLSVLCQDPQELTYSQATIVSGIIGQIFGYVDSLEVTDYQGLMGLLDALDAVATVFISESRRRRLLGQDRQLTSAAAVDVLAAAGNFSKLIAKGIAVGQSVEVQIMNNFRLSTQIVAAVQDADVTMSEPQTDLEYYSGEAGFYISFTPFYSSALKIGLVIANIDNYAAVSDHVYTNPVQIIADSQALKSFTYLVYNNEPIDVLDSDYASPFFVTNCTNAIFTDSMVCPGGISLQNFCNGIIAGSHIQQCPIPVAQCSVFNSDTYTVFEGRGCMLSASSSNAQYSTCNCTMSLPAGYDVFKGKGEANLVTSLTYVTSSFPPTFVAAPSSMPVTASSAGASGSSGSSGTFYIIVIVPIVGGIGILCIIVLFVRRLRSKNLQVVNEQVVSYDPVGIVAV